MDITLYDVIKGPIVTGKAYQLNNMLKKLVIEVHMHANKPLVKKALEKLFNVKVESVNIYIRKGKNHMVRRQLKQRVSTKRAIVTLKEGYSAGMLNVVEAASQNESSVKQVKG